MLSRIEHRYRLPAGHFRARLPHQTRAVIGLKLAGIEPSEQRRLAWHLILPDLGDLYTHLSAYIRTHRGLLLGNAADPGTLFVKTVKTTSRDAAYDQNTFYEAWRLAIQRYGIWNPYTGRGVIKGLLPHGPHNVRDVIATHILKQTGSYEQASYAIQDTPDVVAKHYGRFLPQDKSALVAEILNRVWQAA